MKNAIESVAQAFGLTTLCLFWLLFPLLQERHYEIYHWSGPSSIFFVPVLLDFAIVWFFLATLFRLLGNSRSGVGILFWSAVFFLCPIMIVANCDVYFAVPLNNLVFLVLFLLGAVATLFILVAFWTHRLPLSWIDNAIQGIVVFLKSVAFAGLLLLVEFGGLAWEARHLNLPESLHHPSAASMASPRPLVIWLIFDELSYRLVYEQRFPGLELPNFDNLAAQSSVFTHVIPAGDHTEIVIPSLMTGVAIDRIELHGNGLLSIHRPGVQRVQPFDPNSTIFYDALQLGYGTAVAGWYNPYCRIMPSVLDHCFWSYQEHGSSGMVPYGTIGQNMLAPVVRLAFHRGIRPLVSHLIPQSVLAALARSQQLEDYQRIRSSANELLRDPSANFILLHLPIPHPVGIYNRATGQFSHEDTSYLDNLALSDRFLGELRATLQDSGQWDSTTLVIMGDHSYRSYMWNSKDKQAIHGDVFDGRPAYVVKLPQQKTPNIVATPYRATETRALLQQLLARTIQTPVQLNAWINSRATSAPPK